MINIALLSGAALLAAGLAAVQSAPPRPDPNADVTRAQLIERVDQRFARLDADRNGSISREEMNQARTQREARRGQRMAGGPGMRGRRMMRGQRMAMHMFGEDGVATREEFRQRALERFDRADADRNGTLTAAERRAARPHRGMRMRHGPDGPPPPPQD